MQQNKTLDRHTFKRKTHMIFKVKIFFMFKFLKCIELAFNFLLYAARKIYRRELKIYFMIGQNYF